MQLRPQGRFYAAKFVTKSSWAVEGSVLNLDFGKFGKYEFSQADAGAWHGIAPSTVHPEAATPVTG